MSSGSKIFFVFFEECDHLCAEELSGGRRAYDAVVVLAGGRAALLDNELVDLKCRDRV